MARISPETIERIRSAANILDVVSEYVSLRRAGSSYRGLCPFHDDTTPSFSVSPARGICKCFACGEGGDTVHFIMKQEQLGYIDALKFLAKKYHIEVEERELTSEERALQNERESMFAVNEWACNYFEQSLQQSEEGRTIGLAYFRSRHFRDDIIARFRLGFCQSSYDAMSNAALAEGYKADYLVNTGLCARRDNGTLYDKYHGRVIFPWFTVSGKVVGFGGRVLDARTKGVNQKYINSSESVIYHKGRELYGLFQAKKAIAREENVFMVEGYTDVLSMHQCGIENVVANSGTALSKEQVNILHRFTNNITLLYDGDAAGQKAALRGTDMLLAQGMRVKILLLPDNDDPDSFAQKHNAKEFQEYVKNHQTDFITFKTNLLLREAQNDPIKMADLIKSIIETIAVVPEEIDRATYIHRCSEILHQNESMLVREVARKREANDEQRMRERERKEQFAANVNAGAQVESGAEQTSSETAPAVADGSPSAVPTGEGRGAASAPSDRFVQMESLIIQMIVRHGEEQVTYMDMTGQTVQNMLLNYIHDSLHAQNVVFHSELYWQMLEEVYAAPKTEGFSPANYFMNNSREDFSREAAQLLGDAYMLQGSDIVESKSNLEKATHIMLEYFALNISTSLEEVMRQLASPEAKSDPANFMELLKRQMALNNAKKEIAKRLGDRVL